MFIVVFIFLTVCLGVYLCGGHMKIQKILSTISVQFSNAQIVNAFRSDKVVAMEFEQQAALVVATRGTHSGIVIPTLSRFQTLRCFF